jgi:hypothetical protein
VAAEEHPVSDVLPIEILEALPTTPEGREIVDELAAFLRHGIPVPERTIARLCIIVGAATLVRAVWSAAGEKGEKKGPSGSDA